MIGDVLLLAEKHEKAAKEIMARLEGRNLKKIIIAVSGESGAGKSEIAHLLRKALKARGLVAKTLHTDNYYKTLPRERTEWRQQHGVKECVGLNEYRWDLIAQHLDDFKNSRENVTLPFIDIVTDQVDQLTTSFRDIDVLVLEGLYAIGAEADFKALIDLTYHDTKDAQSLRGKEPQNQFRAAVLEAEHVAVQSMRDKADLLITKQMMGLA
jgi:uridine kinase